MEPASVHANYDGEIGLTRRLEVDLRLLSGREHGGVIEAQLPLLGQRERVGGDRARCNQRLANLREARGSCPVEGKHKFACDGVTDDDVKSSCAWGRITPASEQRATGR